MKMANFFTLRVKKGVVFVVGPKGGLTRLFLADGKTLNPKLPKAIMQILGPHRSELIQQKDEALELTDEDIAEIEKELQEYQLVANKENEDPAVRKRAREKYSEKSEEKTQLVNKRAQLEQEREQLVEKLPYRERIKALFKKYGFTVATVVAAVGIAIGAIYQLLKNGASAATNAIKDVSKEVGDGLKE